MFLILFVIIIRCTVEVMQYLLLLLKTTSVYESFTEISDLLEGPLKNTENVMVLPLEHGWNFLVVTCVVYDKEWEFEMELSTRYVQQ